MSKRTQKQLRRRVGRTARGLTKTNQALKGATKDLASQYIFLSKTLAGIGLIQLAIVEILKQDRPDVEKQIQDKCKEIATNANQQAKKSQGQDGTARAPDQSAPASVPVDGGAALVPGN